MTPAAYSSRSVSVVLPASTCARIPKFSVRRRESANLPIRSKQSLVVWVCSCAHGMAPWSLALVAASKAQGTLRNRTRPRSVRSDVREEMQAGPRRYAALVAAVAAVVLALPASSLAVPTPPPGFIDTLVASSLEQGTAMAFDPSGRLFVTLQGGSVRVIRDGQLLPTPFVTLSVDSANERGLLGITFDPSFAATTTCTSTTRYGPPSTIESAASRPSATSPLPAASGPPRPAHPLSNGHQPQRRSHALRRRRQAVRRRRRQRRVRPTRRRSTTCSGRCCASTRTASIPTDNPFYTRPPAATARSGPGPAQPFTFAVQPGTGRIFINDVGQNT